MQTRATRSISIVVLSGAVSLVASGCGAKSGLDAIARETPGADAGPATPIERVRDAGRRSRATHDAAARRPSHVGSDASLDARVSFDAPLSVDAPPDGPLVVHGRVTGGRVPLGGLPVGYGTEFTVTSGDGSFSLYGMGETYNILVGEPTAGVLWVFQGLTRRDPTLHVDPTDPARVVNVGVSLSGVSAQNGLGGAVAFVSRETSATNSFTGAGPGPYGTFAPLWNDDYVARGNVRALLWSGDAYGGPAAYRGYGASPFSADVEAGAGSAAVDLEPVGSAVSSITVAPPAGLVASPPYTLLLRFPDEAAWPFCQYDPAPTDPFDVAFPALPSARTAIVVGARDGATNTTRASARMIDLTNAPSHASATLPTPVSLLEPLDGARSELGRTRFSWTPSNDCVYELVVGALGPALVFHLHVVTAKTNVALSDISLAGALVPTAVTWNVSTTGPAASVDDVSGPEPPFRFALEDNAFGNYTATSSEARTLGSASADGGP